MAILRLSRTFPSNEHKNLGLQCFIFSKYYSKRNYTFIKDDNYQYLKLKNNKLFKIKYNEVNLKSENYFIFNYIVSILTKFYANILFFFQIINKISIKKNINCIHIHNFNFLVTGVLIKLLFKKKCYLSVGGTDILHLKKKKLFTYFLSKIDTVFSVSKYHKNILRKIYPKLKIIVIGNGVDLNIYKYKKNKKKNIFISIGNIRWQKDYLTAIKAFNLFNKKQKKKYKYFIIGNNLEREQYIKCHNLIKQKKLCKQVYLVGYKNSKYIKQMLYKSKALILSSVSEGLPKVILEAISCGTPVISSDVGDNKKILDKCGLIFKQKNFRNLSKLMMKIANNSHLQLKLQKECKKTREDYSWKKIYQKVERYY